MMPTGGRNALGCGNPTKLRCAYGALMISLDLRVGEPVTYVQAPRLKVTGPCFVGFQLPDFRLRAVCGGAPQTFCPHMTGWVMPSIELAAQQDEYVRSFVMSMIRSLIEDREQIVIELVPSEAFVTLKVKASTSVISVLVGPKGQMARALRTLLAGSSAKLGRRYAIDLIEERL